MYILPPIFQFSKHTGPAQCTRFGTRKTPVSAANTRTTGSHQHLIQQGRSNPGTGFPWPPPARLLEKEGTSVLLSEAATPLKTHAGMARSARAGMPVGGAEHGGLFPQCTLEWNMA